MKIGDFVEYTAFEGAKPELGRVKSFSDSEHVFVVYKCAGEWNNYTNYTAARTHISQLKVIPLLDPYIKERV